MPRKLNQHLIRNVMSYSFLRCAFLKKSKTAQVPIITSICIVLDAISSTPIKIALKDEWVHSNKRNTLFLISHENFLLWRELYIWTLCAMESKFPKAESIWIEFHSAKFIRKLIINSKTLENYVDTRHKVESCWN